MPAGRFPFNREQGPFPLFPQRGNAARIGSSPAVLVLRLHEKCGGRPHGQGYPVFGTAFLLWLRCDFRAGNRSFNRLSDAHVVIGPTGDEAYGGRDKRIELSAFVEFPEKESYED